MIIVSMVIVYLNLYYMSTYIIDNHTITIYNVGRGDYMIKVNLEEVLQEQGKTAYWLSKQTGISQNSLSKIVKNETTGINFDTLEKICLALDCSIEDILKLEK